MREILSERDASTLEARKAAVATAAKTAQDEKDPVAAVVENSSTLEAKGTAAAQAAAIILASVLTMISVW